MKGYKVFNPDWTCRGFQYEVGKEYKHNGNIEVCGSGFHFCRQASDCFNYYNFDSNNKVAEIEAIGHIESEGDKSVTDYIKIVKELTWQEVLVLVNTGKDCTGRWNSGNRNNGDWNSGNWNNGNRNNGDWNSGNWNNGNRNNGDWNSGDWNSGNCNSGNCNSGDWNSGNRNSGDCNSGDWNSGNWNSGNRNNGNRNSGNCNSGNCNSGDWNSGNRNSGNCNSGDWNSGNRNSGDCNSGDWNSGNWNSGMFNTEKEPKIKLFNKDSNLSYSQTIDIKGIQILNWNYENNLWIYKENMTEEEKKNNPDFETLGGYLKVIDYKEACKMMWDKLDAEEKEEVKNIPNFDKDTFYEITGIEVK